MKLVRAIFLATLTVGVALSVAHAQPPAEKGWKPTLEQARATAAGKPVLLYFYNREARPCREIEATLADASLAPLLGRFALAAVNNTESPELGRTHKIIKVPTIILFDAAGKELDRAVGFKTAPELVLYLENATSAGRVEGQAAVDVEKPGPDTRPVNFTVQCSARAQQVYIMGDFNDWREKSLAMRRRNKSEWEITLHLRGGVYEYKFVDDRGEYYTDINNPNRAIKYHGGYNSVMLVSDTAKPSPMVDGRTVTFMLYRPDAKDVQVAGSFNEWQRFTMYRNPADPAMWGVKYDLPPGEYRYRYIIDGVWTTDPENYSPFTETDKMVNSSFVIK